MIAAPFELDLFDGEAWLGVVPFYMTNVAFSGTPSLQPYQYVGLRFFATRAPCSDGVDARRLERPRRTT